MKEESVTCKISDPVENSIIFGISNGNWVMKITDGKISFNRESWPDAAPDEFAKAVIAILEGATVDMDNLRKQIPFA